MTLFALYRALGTAATPLARRHLKRRCARGREDPARLDERLGHAGYARPPGPLVWIHGASVGESLSALPLIARIRARWPDLGILVTTGTVTSARLMAERLPPAVIHQYVPVDLPGAVNRFLDHWRPALGLIVESEFWPNLLLEARRRGIELTLVNGRVSARSFATWRRARPIIARLLAQFSLVLAQLDEDARPLEALGAARTLCMGNLKFAAPPLEADPAELARLRARLGARPRWLAASTHPGEEAQIAVAHRALATGHPGLLSVIAPRHPHRGAEIVADLAAAGLAVARRGAGEDPDPATEIYVADTMGELGLWYRLGEIVFVGGSLVPKGGQNMVEPAKLGRAVLCGPHTANFMRVTDEMTRAGALGRVADGSELAATVGALMSDAAARRAMIEAGRAYATAQAGVLDDIVAALAPLLDRAAQGRFNPAVSSVII